MAPRRLAGVELGGTSVRVAISEGEPTNIIDRIELPTTTPEETLNGMADWLETKKPFDAIGVASFGPVDLNKESKTYGYITSTPKKLWKNVDVLSGFKKFNVPIAFDTDVNAPAVAELHYGDHGDVQSCAYITVGTGVGVGAVVNGKTVTGLMHMEGGHAMVPRAAGDDYEGICPFHKTCVEGMTTANALAARKGVPITALPGLDDSDPIWDMAAHYLAALCMNITLLLSPEVIIISGGVLKRESLFPKIRTMCRDMLNGYVQVDKIVNHTEQYIVPSKFGNDMGIISACALAENAVKVE